LRQASTGGEGYQDDNLLGSLKLLPWHLSRGEDRSAEADLKGFQPIGVQEKVAAALATNIIQNFFRSCWT